MAAVDKWFGIAASEVELIGSPAVFGIDLLAQVRQISLFEPPFFRVGVEFRYPLLVLKLVSQRIS